MIGTTRLYSAIRSKRRLGMQKFLTIFSDRFDRYKLDSELAQMMIEMLVHPRGPLVGR
jgi:hypothetical protein